MIDQPTPGSVRTFHGIMTLPAVIAMMLGAESGTYADTLKASIGRNRGAIRTGIFHLFFNVAGVMLLIGFTSPAVRFLHWLIPEQRLEEEHTFA